MIATKDSLLEKCCPDDMPWDKFMRDCEEAINNADVHSDEISSDDETLAQDERNNNKRPENILNTSSVIKVYDKTWRSRRVSCEVIFF